MHLFGILPSSGNLLQHIVYMCWLLVFFLQDMVIFFLKIPKQPFVGFARVNYLPTKLGSLLPNIY
jgi:hypothetical protein